MNRRNYLRAGATVSDVDKQVCAELDPNRYFIPSALYGGVNANDPRERSSNGYTNMWFVPGFDYLNFASEDTRITCPTLKSIEKFMLSDEIFLQGYSTLLLHENKYPFPETWLPYAAGEAWGKTGSVEQFYDATDAASFVNRVGMTEGVYCRDVIERQRRGRLASDTSGERRCGGYLVWKFYASWSEIYACKVDYFLEPYHINYTLRTAFKFNEWNHYRMETFGDSIKVWANENPTSNLVQNKYSKSCIVIKIHSISNFSEFENI